MCKIGILFMHNCCLSILFHKSMVTHVIIKLYNIILFKSMRILKLYIIIIIIILCLLNNKLIKMVELN